MVRQADLISREGGDGADVAGGVEGHDGCNEDPDTFKPHRIGDSKNEVLDKAFQSKDELLVKKRSW